MPLTDSESKLARAIADRAAPLLDDLRRHVNTPTGGHHTPGLDETREVLTARLEALGAKTAIIPGDPKPAWLDGQPAGGIPPTAICDRTRNATECRVLIAGHLDTVHDPDSDFNALSIAPDGKTATGPGCVDMKGGLVIALHALEALEDTGIDVAWTYLLNSDEETGTFHSTAALADASTKHHLGIALEPALADGSLAIERVGSGQFMIETKGRAAHVGRAFTDGVSAVTALARAIVAVGDMPEPEAGRVLNIGPIQGGVAANAVPDHARAWGNCRYPDSDAAEIIEQQLRDIETAPDAMPAVRVETLFNRPAKPMTPAVEAFGLAARAVAEDLGQQLPFAKTGGVCDGNIMQHAGLPTIDTLGVRGGGLHTPEEWIDLTSLVERCQLLAILLARIAEGRVAIPNIP